MGCPCTGGTVHKNRKIACMYVEAAKLGQQSMNPKVNKQTITIRIPLKYWNYFFKLIVFLVSLLSVNIFLIYYYSGNIQSFKTKKTGLKQNKYYNSVLYSLWCMYTTAQPALLKCSDIRRRFTWAPSSHASSVLMLLLRKRQQIKAPNILQ